MGLTAEPTPSRRAGVESAGIKPLATGQGLNGAKTYGSLLSMDTAAPLCAMPSPRSEVSVQPVLPDHWDAYVSSARWRCNPARARSPVRRNSRNPTSLRSNSRHRWGQAGKLLDRTWSPLQLCRRQYKSTSGQCCPTTRRCCSRYPEACHMRLRWSRPETWRWPGTTRPGPDHLLPGGLTSEQWLRHMK